MTRQDVTWIGAAMLFAFSVTTIGIILWQTRQVRRDAREMEEQVRARRHLKMTHPARHWAVVPRPPYDYERQGD